jgi:hypothetical protein
MMMARNVILYTLEENGSTPKYISSGTGGRFYTENIDAVNPLQKLNYVGMTDNLTETGLRLFETKDELKTYVQDINTKRTEEYNKEVEQFKLENPDFVLEEPEPVIENAMEEVEISLDEHIDIFWLLKEGDDNG